MTCASHRAGSSTRSFVPSTAQPTWANIFGSSKWAAFNGVTSARKSQRVTTALETLYTIPCEAVFNQHPQVRRTALVGTTRPSRRGLIIIAVMSKPWSQTLHCPIPPGMTTSR